MSFLGITPVMVKSMSARLASISSWLPAKCSLVGESTLLPLASVVFSGASIAMIWACICSGFPFSALNTFSASSGVPSESTICHSAKLISSTFLLFTKAAACSAGVGGTYFVIAKLSGGLVAVAASASTSVQPASLP